MLASPYSGGGVSEVRLAITLRDKSADLGGQNTYLGR